MSTQVLVEYDAETVVIAQSTVHARGLVYVSKTVVLKDSNMVRMKFKASAALNPASRCRTELELGFKTSCLMT